MKNIFTSLLFLLVLVSCLQCRKERNKPPTTLPPITQEGKNTFGCKVNGQVWVPYYKCGGSGNPCGEIYTEIFPLSTQDKLPIRIDMNATQRRDTRTDFQISTKQGISLYTTGNKIDSITISYYNYKNNSFDPYTNNLVISSNNKFEITKLDTVNRIISGVFDLVLYKSFTDSIHITEGRFDLKFQACKCTH